MGLGSGVRADEPLATVGGGVASDISVRSWSVASMASRVRPSRWLMRDVALPFVVTRVLLAMTGLVAAATLPLSPYVPRDWTVPGLSSLVDAFSRWDALHYVHIAADGYAANDISNAAFFPLYPILVRASGMVIGRSDLPTLYLLAVLVANVALFVAAALLVMLTRLDFDGATASRASWYLLVFPTSLFLSAGYAESLFLALSVGAMLAARRRHWALAGVLGAMGALCRPFGFLLLLPLAVEAWEQRAEPHPWRKAVAVGVVPLGLVAYMGYLGLQYGNMLAFLHAETQWDRKLMPPWDTFIRFFQAPLTINSGLHSLVDLGFTIAVIAMAVLAWKMLRRSYALFLTAVLLVPLSSGALLSMPRFAVAWFPIFLVLAVAGRSAAFDRIFLIVGASLSGILMALYAQWYWVS